MNKNDLTKKLENVVDAEIAASFFEHSKCIYYNIYLLNTRGESNE